MSLDCTGKVEGSHRADEEELCRRVTFRSSQDLREELREWEHQYKHFQWQLALGGKTRTGRACELRINTPQAVSRQLG